MSDQSIQKIKKILRDLYPNLFDDSSAESKLGPLISQADMNLSRYKGSNVDGNEYRQLVTLMTAHLLYQSEDNDVSSFHVADVSYTAANNSKANSNNSDPYISQLLELLNSLGLNDKWGIQLG